MLFEKKKKAKMEKLIMFIFFEKQSHFAHSRNYYIVYKFRSYTTINIDNFVNINFQTKQKNHESHPSSM